MQFAEHIYVQSRTGTNMLAVPKGAIADQKRIDLLLRNQIHWVEIVSARPTKPKLGESMPIPASTQTPVVKYSDEPPEISSILGDELRKEAIQNISSVFSAISEPGTEANKTTAYQAIKDFERTLGQVVAAVTHDISGLIHIHDLKSYDEYTYHHSLSVALLSIATGQVLGLNPQELLRLGKCALLHDVGKQTIPLEITNKKGKLTKEEYALMKAHPINGARDLKAKAIGDVELWSGVMFHHEKYDGSGYPRGLKSKEIPLFARIVSVADVYDAVTSYRSYRNPMTPADAYELLCCEVGKSFEFEILKAFAERLSLYPIGTALELSDGRRVVVTNTGNVLRPVVKVWETNEIIDLSSVNNLTLIITRVINPEEMFRTKGISLQDI